MKMGGQPRFSQGQTVSFLGGSGKIKSYHPEAGNWSYMIEMEMGAEPEMGRIGPETTILLHQCDLSDLNLSETK